MRACYLLVGVITGFFLVAFVTNNTMSATAMPGSTSLMSPDNCSHCRHTIMVANGANIISKVDVNARRIL